MNDLTTWSGISLELADLAPSKRLEVEAIQQECANIGNDLYRLWRACDCSKKAFTERLQAIIPSMTYAEAFDLMDYWMEKSKR